MPFAFVGYASRDAPRAGSRRKSLLNKSATKLAEFAALAFRFSSSEKRNGTKSSVDDLGTGRGVVLNRAATILRFIETHPLTGGFVTSSGGFILEFLFFHFFFISRGATGAHFSHYAAFFVSMPY